MKRKIFRKRPMTVILALVTTVLLMPMMVYANSTLSNEELSGSLNQTLAVTDGVAEVDGTVYDTVQDAIDAVAGSGQAGTVTLLSDTVEYICIPAGADITLDLNGCTLNAADKEGFDVYGSLTVTDSVGGGAMVQSYTNDYGTTAIIYVIGESATFTLESGTIRTGDGVEGIYGVYCQSGGTAVINGGEIISGYAALTGNNTTGNMNFEINGGTITTTSGPAIYMPGQMTLTITGGTINGGISLRMGQVYISGGTINAQTDATLDELLAYYFYSGNVYCPDALYVLGGTYTSTDETYGNSLNITITGGVFNCANGVGSAVAIYDLAEIAQDSNISIEGGEFYTNSTTRLAYQVVSLTDLGIAEADLAAGYNNSDYLGEVETAITGGIYSTDVSAYVAEEYRVLQNSNGTYIVCNHSASTAVEFKEPTCEEGGNIQYWYCANCDRYFSDEALTEQISQSDTALLPTGHTLVAVGANPATCTQEGYEAYWECSACGALFSDEEGTQEISAPVAIAVTDHSFGEWTVTKEATETAQGEQVRTCSICGTIETDVIPTLTTDTESSTDDTTEDETSSTDTTTDEASSTDTTTDEASSSSTTTDETNPQTGDNSSIAFWIILMLAEAVCFTGAVVYRRRFR